MATYTPPPYFPQSSLAPPDKNRYRRFKFMVALAVLILVCVFAGLGVAAWFFFRTVL